MKFLMQIAVTLFNWIFHWESPITSITRQLIKENFKSKTIELGKCIFVY